MFKVGNQINKGRIPWNKGAKGLQIAWNKGKKCPYLIGNQYGFKKGIGYWEGKTRSKETKEKISKSKMGSIPWNKGKKCPYMIGNQFGFKKGQISWLKGTHIQCNTGRTHFKKGFHPLTEWKEGQFKGSNHYNWKGGISSLGKMIRNNIENIQWREEVFKRDNYTCQDCGDTKGGNLRAHHKISFEVIFQEFLREYDQFSPIEDKETLVRLATKYEPFWDVSNGKTLCKKCHKKYHRRKYDSYCNKNDL